MTRYRVTGIPLSPPFTALQGREVGEVFSAKIDPTIEDVLVGAGALEIVNEPTRKAETAKPEEPAAKTEDSDAEQTKERPAEQPATERPAEQPAAERPGKRAAAHQRSQQH